MFHVEQEWSVSDVLRLGLRRQAPRRTVVESPRRPLQVWQPIFGRLGALAQPEPGTVARDRPLVNRSARALQPVPQGQLRSPSLDSCFTWNIRPPAERAFVRTQGSEILVAGSRSSRWRSASRSSRVRRSCSTLMPPGRAPHGQSIPVDRPTGQRPLLPWRRETWSKGAAGSCHLCRGPRDRG